MSEKRKLEKKKQKAKVRAAERKQRKANAWKPPKDRRFMTGGDYDD